MHIYLVRHTKYHNPENIFPFHLPVYLSTEGRGHAQRIAEWFRHQKLLELPIYTSPILRCVQTAEIIAGATGSFVMSDGRLVETASPDFQGKVKPATDSWKHEQEDPTREPQASIEDRVADIFAEKMSIGQDCILVSHGDPLTILYYRLQQQPLPDHLWDPKNVDKVIDRGEIVEIEIKDGTVTNLKRRKV
ncbi:MAG: histidine phosphatase family protein [bacterium]|nr:histidine phosphatase family protein [bacterium]